MRVLGAAELLDLWERGLRQPPARRAVALLAAACPELSPGEAAALPLGRRDAYLLDLRELLLGPELTIVANCPNCGEQLDSTFRCADIRAEATPVEPTQTIEADAYRIAFRLPAGDDLLALSRSTDRAAARRMLLERCILNAAHGGVPTDVASLPETVIAALAASMAAADPQGDVELALSCPACAHAWRGAFDVAGFFWQEIHAWAKSMLRSVHTLARAYGWREADVLALSPTRRQIYLELAQQ
jgi:uncharacterized protein (UPF0212 family)